MRPTTRILPRLLLVAATLVPSLATAQQSAPESDLFQQGIAPLLRTRCLECHDSASEMGRLNLSTKQAAFTGGESGKVIVPGKPEQSLLWTQVEDDSMPQDRPPLSKAEKELLKQWIAAGASWSLESIAPKVTAEHVNWLQRLTVDEYIETVRVATGVDIAEAAGQLLPPDLRADGFRNTAYNLNVDLSHVEAYAKLAAMIVRQMDIEQTITRFAGKLQGKPQLRPLVQNMGTWMLRGPLNEKEVEAYLAIGRAVEAEGGNYEEAVSFILEAMLQSPRFLYRVEQQQGDGSPRPATGYEMASRLSYILWGAPPDEALLQAAAAEELSTPAQVRKQAQRMLEDPRAIARSSQFAEQWLHLSRLESLSPSPELYPNWNPELAADMRKETLTFFRDVAWNQNRPLTDLLNAQSTHITPRLAAHYNLPLANAQPSPVETVKRDDALVALYTFDEAEGNRVRDHASQGDFSDLIIVNTKQAEWSEAGLTLTGNTLLSTEGKVPNVSRAIEQAQAFTLEAWVRPENTRQDGPARIVSLSSGTSNRNFQLGQEGDKYDFRFRTERTDRNGMPSLSSRSNSVNTELTHVVYTREANGQACLYVNGQEQAARKVEGKLSNWDHGFRLNLGNEDSGDRPWLGTFRMVALYASALSEKEVQQRAALGGKAWQMHAEPQQVDLAEVPHRGGLLTHGSILTMGGDHASMVTRGLFVLHDLLHGQVKDPPPCVDTTPVPTKPGISQRSIAEARLANKACGGCHVAFEPLAFGLERFDGLGTYRPVDRHGNKLRDDGEILFPGAKQPVPYQNAAELMDLLAASPRVRESIARKVVQFALGRPLVAADEELVQQIDQAAHEQGGTYASLITEVVASPLVMTTRTENPSSGDGK